ncbi:MAG: cellulase family glycosylhydrolase [Armatimonadetes bacterium]|nr:cellulase family glycosylhydrolase [Armatimonadota bacterium]
MRALLLPLLLAAGCVAQLPPVGGLGSATGAEWELTVRPDATPELRWGQSPVLTLGWVTWGANWAWQGTDVQLGPPANGVRPVEVRVPGLGYRLDGRLTSDGRQLIYRFDIDVQKPQAGIMGTCLELHPKLSPGHDPELLPDNGGWRWDTGHGTVSLTFEPGCANAYFERGNKSVARLFLLAGDVPAGKRALTMTLSLPAGTVALASAAERYGDSDPAAWPADAMLPDRSPVDLSFLNDAPAGKHGFVQPRGDDLAFADGTPARFWGGNLAAYALFVGNAEIDAHARRIAQLGYNLMRIHHMDSTGWVSPTLIDKSQPDTRHLDARAFDRLDYWVKALRDNGVYVWLDLHVGRQLKPADADTELGRVNGFDELQKQHGEVKGFCYYNPPVQALMEEFATQYLSHVNTYTGTAYRDEPAVVGLLLTNENDLTQHFGNLMLGDKGNPVHNAVFMADVNAFCKTSGLPADRTWRTWEPGPAKIYLNDAEHRFNQHFLAALQGVGAKAPVATTNCWAGCGFFSLPALADGGWIDAHSYGDAGFLETNPHTDANFLAAIAGSAVAGKPLSITEWNVPYPAADRFLAPLYVASVGALQGWDAPMIYNYSQEGLANPSRPSTWSTFSDPAFSALMPAAALAYRQGHVHPARRTVCLRLDRQQTYFAGLNGDRSAAVRTLAETSRVVVGLPDVPELTWDQASPAPLGAVDETDPQRDFVPAGQSYVVSDTGELTRDWIRGIQLIDTPQTQAAGGWLGGKTLRLTDLTVSLQTPQAQVVASSLDGKPLRASARVLLTVAARVSAPGGRLPFRAEPVAGELSLRRDAPAVVVPLTGDGTAGEPLPAALRDGRLTVTLTGREGTHWFELRTVR